MSKIHYFQRYSQKENVVTNNTLLLFSRLYNDNTLRFEGFINSLIDDSRIAIDIGVSFRQQEGNKSKSSIPDGSMIQQSLKVLIETKLYDNYSKSQLEGHLDGFENEDTQVLLLINPTETPLSFDKSTHAIVDDYNKKHSTHIQFCSVTFKQIIDAMGDVIPPHFIELEEILNDYREFCESMSLLPRHEFTMRALASSDTFSDNMTHGIFFDPVNRSYSRHHYVGLYKNKSVRGVGVLQKVIWADYDKTTNKFTKLEVRLGSAPDDDEQKRIVAIMNAALQNNGWDISAGYQFFIVDKFFPTAFKKITKYPIQHSKFFDLGSVLNKEILPDSEEVAELLKAKTWE
jgi:hypothetical protein